MKSNNPIIKTIEIPLTYNEDGSVATFETKEILLDRLGIQMNTTPKANINAPITQSVLISFKKSSEDGWIFNDNEETMFIDDIAKCEDMDVLIAFAKIDAALTELVNKKGF